MSADVSIGVESPLGRATISFSDGQLAAPSTQNETEYLLTAFTRLINCVVRVYDLDPAAVAARILEGVAS